MIGSFHFCGLNLGHDFIKILKRNVVLRLNQLRTSDFEP